MRGLGVSLNRKTQTFINLVKTYGCANSPLGLGRNHACGEPFISFTVNQPLQLPCAELSPSRVAHCLGLPGPCRFQHGQVPYPTKLLNPEQTGCLLVLLGTRHWDWPMSHSPNPHQVVVLSSTNFKNKEVGLQGVKRVAQYHLAKKW